MPPLAGPRQRSWPASTARWQGWWGRNLPDQHERLREEGAYVLEDDTEQEAADEAAEVGKVLGRARRTSVSPATSEDGKKKGH